MRVDERIQGLTLADVRWGGGAYLRGLRGPLGLTVLITAVALIGLGITWEWLFQRTSERFAIQELGRSDAASGRAVLDPFIVDELLVGDPAAVERLAAAGASLIRDGGAAGINVWSKDNRLLWSDAPGIAGEGMDEEERELLTSQGTLVELTSHRAPLGTGDIGVLAVDFGSMTPSGEPVVVEVFYPDDVLHTLAADERRSFRPLLLMGLGLVVIAQVPVLRAVRRHHMALADQRAELVRRSIATSDNERRRIAAEVHDGPIQDLIGITIGLTAAAATVAEPQREDLRNLASEARSTVRSLRSLLNSIYPVDVPATGWVGGLDPIIDALRQRGVVVDVDVPDLKLAPTSELLMLRVGREALRNVSAHARASHVSITLQQKGPSATLKVVDDGVGFDEAIADSQRHAGHLGLQLLYDLVLDTGATLTIDSTPGDGTTVSLEFQENQ